MTNILSIDPGTKKSGVVERIDGRVRAYYLDNGQVRQAITDAVVTKGIPIVAVETMEDSYGRSVDSNTTLTLEETGVFLYLAETAGATVIRCPRRAVKKHICGSMSAKDPDVKAAMIKRFGEEGTKKAPGPTFGFNGHCFQALAAGVYAEETQL